jgi:hypothetical protein
LWGGIVQVGFFVVVFVVVVEEVVVVVVVVEEGDTSLVAKERNISFV